MSKIEMKPIDSAMFSHAGSDGTVQHLTFKKFRQTYQYSMPKELFERFLASDSKGKFFQEHIRPHYHGEKV
ncbi:MAG: KTSC domain-containing protein [Terriglobales bacterium]